MPTQNVRLAEIRADIIVNGGSFAAVAAALAAARSAPQAQVLLIEPTDWLGGQSTSQGVSAIDNAWHNPGATIMREAQDVYYPKDYQQWLHLMRTAPPEAPGEGLAPNGSAWVTREAFDPRTGAWALDQLVDPVPNITVLKLTVVKDVASEPVDDAYGAGRRITSLTLVERVPANGYVPFTKFLSEELPDWYSTEDSADFTKKLYRVVPRNPAKGLVVIEASEAADAAVLSGAQYTIGRELATEEVAEDGTLPAIDENGPQATVYCFCMTDAPEPSAEADLKTPWPEFDTYYEEQSRTYYGYDIHTWERIWTYRRLKNTGPVFADSTVNAGDVTMQNWFPGNDYPYGSIYKTTSEVEAELAAPGGWAGGMRLNELREAEKHAIGWYFYMKDRRPTSWDTLYLRGDHPLNMMGTPHGLAKFPYIRCGRRLVGADNFRITERYWTETSAPDYDGKTSFRFYDSVGIGSYAADVHPQKGTTGLSPTKNTPAPFYIPYRALTSSNVRNLLAAGKTMAQTFISNSGYRLHPIEWASGSAAGVAAAHLLRDGGTTHDLLELPRLRALQNEIAENSPIHWPIFDPQPIPPRNGDLIVNGLSPIVAGEPFTVEVYHFRGVRARVYQGENLIGETSTKANGRLVLAGAKTGSPTAPFRAEVFDAQGDKLDEIHDRNR